MLSGFAKSLSASAAALVAVLALGSCGGDGERDPPSEPPAELLATALANPAQSGVSQIQLDLGIEGDSLLSGPSSVELSGPFALDQAGGLPRFDLALDAGVAGFGIDGELISTGDDAFVVFFGENYRVGPERVAAVQEQLRSPAATGLRIDRWFEGPRYAGAEEVAGTETERIEGTLNGAAAARDLSALARALGAPALVEALGAGARSGPVEAWVAFDDKTIRRIRLQFPFTVPPQQRAEASGITGGTVSLDAEISDVGSDSAIEPPPGGGFQPIEDLLEQLGDLASLGGL